MDMLFLVPLGRGSHAGQGQMFPVTGLGLFNRSYKVIRDCLLPALVLEVHRRWYPANRGWLSPVLSLDQLSKRLCKLLGLLPPASYP